jgi:hypothetical protein
VRIVDSHLPAGHLITLAPVRLDLFAVILCSKRGSLVFEIIIVLAGDARHDGVLKYGNLPVLEFIVDAFLINSLAVI